MYDGQFHTVYLEGIDWLSADATQEEVEIFNKMPLHALRQSIEDARIKWKTQEYAL